MVPLVFFFFLMNIPPVHPWDTNQENYNGLFKGFFEENKTIFSLVRKSGVRTPVKVAMDVYKGIKDVMGWFGGK